MVEVMESVWIGRSVGVRAISSRSDIGRRDAYLCATGVEADVHTDRDIDPDDPRNMYVLRAVE